MDVKADRKKYHVNFASLTLQDYRPDYPMKNSAKQNEVRSATKFPDIVVVVFLACDCDHVQISF